MEDEARRKLQAKRLNEHVKLVSTTLNAIGLIVFGAGVLQPLVTQASGPINWSWIALSVILHLLAQSAIRMMRLE